MATLQSAVVVALLLALIPSTSAGQRLFPDDPLDQMPPPLPVVEPVQREFNSLHDFLYNSIRPQLRQACRASAINTIGEVPDSTWFTNRHGKRRMSREELQRGPGINNLPQAPFTVIGKKTEGISPGFRMKDAQGRLYFVKADTLRNPEMTTGAEVVTSKFLHAIGYNVPENYIIFPQLADFTIAPDAEMAKSRYAPRERMTWGDFLDIMNRIPRAIDGSFRLMASLAVEGEPIGSFRFEGTRLDDPNDIVPHQDRRDLRGLHVFSAWLNHSDAKALNTLDTIVKENGVRFIKHYLIDFAASLGSDGDRPKDPRFGHRFIFPEPRDALKIFAAGLIVEPWERLDYSDLKAVGNLTAAGFDPEQWTSNYPNPAFLSRRADDEFWAAKIVTAFSDADIRAIVETGQYTDPAVVNYITRVLIERRDIVGQAYFSKILSLDRFQIQNGELRFEDLGNRYGARMNAGYNVHWFLFDNERQQKSPLPEAGRTLPKEAIHLPNGAYVAAVIDADGLMGQKVIVTFRKFNDGFTLAGIDRSTADRMSEADATCPVSIW